MTTRDVTPLYFRYLVRLLRPFPDFDFAFIKPLRAKSAALLDLAPGARVLDLGCGPGGSLPYLRNAVGPTGEVVGIEISPEVAVNARRRIARHQWRNVGVITAAAQAVELTGTFDGALMFGAPDVYASREVLDNILPHFAAGCESRLFRGKDVTPPHGVDLEPATANRFPEALVPDDTGTRRRAVAPVGWPPGTAQDRRVLLRLDVPRFRIAPRKRQSKPRPVTSPAVAPAGPPRARSLRKVVEGELWRAASHGCRSSRRDSQIKRIGAP